MAHSILQTLRPGCHEMRHFADFLIKNGRQPQPYEHLQDTFERLRGVQHSFSESTQFRKLALVYDNPPKTSFVLYHRETRSCKVKDILVVRNQVYARSQSCITDVPTRTDYRTRGRRRRWTKTPTERCTNVLRGPQVQRSSLPGSHH